MEILFKGLLIKLVDIIQVLCDIEKGSYKDVVEVHVLHEFMEPEFKIVREGGSIPKVNFRDKSIKKWPAVKKYIIFIF